MPRKSSVLELPKRAPASQPELQFQDVDRLENAQGIVAIISQRRRDGSLTFSIQREWITADGRKQRGAFIPEELAGAFQDMLRIVVDRMKQLRAEGDLPFAVRGARGVGGTSC